MDIGLCGNGPAGEKNPESASFIFDGSIDGAISETSILSKRFENLPESVRSRFPVGISKRSAFSVRSTGGLAERFFLDVDYRKDDRDAGADEDSKILLRYLGKPGEFLKELELGDTELELPGARWLSLKGRSGKVSRKSFAGKGTFAYRDLMMVVLGSHQKGKPECEQFEIGAHLRRATIRDVDYVKRLFYRIAPASELPLEPQSVKLFFDDGNGFNNTAATENFFPEGGIKKGFYDILIPNDPRQGYEIDPQTGIVRFLFEIPYGASLAVSYKAASGKEVLRRLIKSDVDAKSSELKNRYLLPQDFSGLSEIFLEDQSGRRTALPSFAFDATGKWIVFESTEPFSPETYLFPPSHSRTILLSYVSTGEKTTVVLSKEPLAESLNVELNGRRLSEGRDYTLSSGGGGALIILHGAKLADRVTVSYNAKEFPNVRQTVGGALLYGTGKPVSVGLSALYDFSPQPSRAPVLGGDAAQVQMIGASIKAEENAGPVKMSFNFEAAGSRYNPNPFGASIVENFDGACRSVAVDIREEFFKPSSKPSSAPGFRSIVPSEFGSVFLRDIVPSNPTERRELFMDLCAKPGEWFGLQRALNPGKGVMDLRPYRHMEMFVYSDGGGGHIHINLGEVSEDSNGNGSPDREDANRDGALDQSEDGGIALENGFVYGAGNNLLDGEDMDCDGRLNMTDSFTEDSVQLNWTGWKKLKVPLRDVASARFLRIWVSGPSKIKVAQILFTGLEYSEEKSPGALLELGAVSSFSDPDAPSLANHPAFQRLYPERNSGMQERSEYERERMEDFALSLDYSLPPAGVVAVKREVQMDFTDQKEIHFFAASTAPAQSIFFLRFGSRSDYFEFTVSVPQLSPHYREFSIHKERFKITGQPDWRNIREIRFGLMNPMSAHQSGRIYVNELFTDKPVVYQAAAFSGESEFSYPVKSLCGLPSIFFGTEGQFFLKSHCARVPARFRTAEEFLRGEEGYKISGGFRSAQGLVGYSREENIQNELLSNGASARAGLFRSFFRSDKGEWDMKPRYGEWQGTLSGSFEKKERTEMNLKESFETLFNRMEYFNPSVNDWTPKKCWLESLFRRDLALGRNSVGSTIEPRWIIGDGRILLAPKAGFEDCYQSSGAFFTARKSLLAVSSEGGAGKMKAKFTGRSENSLQRSDFPSISFERGMNGDLSYEWGKYGNTSCASSLQEKKVVTSSQVLRDSLNVWKYQLKELPFESHSFRQSVEASFAQENIRILNLMRRPEYDWLGLGVRFSVQRERERFMGTSTQNVKVRFPDATLTFSSGPWLCSVGGYMENVTGQDVRERSRVFPVQADYRKKRWEIKNSLSVRSEIKERSGALLSDTVTLHAVSSAKAAFGSPVYQMLKWLRRNVALENRMDMALSLECEGKRGEETGKKVEEWTLKIHQRSDYFLKEGIKVYIAFEGWRFENRMASANNYFAYTVSLGINATF